MIDYNNKAIGEVIRKERKSRNLSQEIFSGLAGMARSHLSMIETGEKNPSFETVWRIANTFGLKPHELVKMIEDEISK